MDATEQSRRLRALQGELERRGLAAYLVPKSDEYMLEYAPPSSEREDMSPQGAPQGAPPAQTYPAPPDTGATEPPPGASPPKSPTSQANPRGTPIPVPDPNLRPPPSLPPEG